MSEGKRGRRYLPAALKCDLGLHAPAGVTGASPRVIPVVAVSDAPRK
jgi:hypothetical protein